LEELFIEINCPYTYCIEAEFAPVWNLGPGVFASLISLHTLDTHAWLYGQDHRVRDHVPEKGAFYRRLPAQGKDGRRFKGMWLSKMHRTKVEIEYTDLDLSDINVEFEGRDADEVWCDGFVFEQVLEGGNRHRRPTAEEDCSWPDSCSKVLNYDGFRRKYQLG
jgi:hypothetical protein